MPGIVEGTRPVTAAVEVVVSGAIASVEVPTDIKTVGVGNGVASVLVNTPVVGGLLDWVVVSTARTVEVKNDAGVLDDGIGVGVGVCATDSTAITAEISRNSMPGYA